MNHSISQLDGPENYLLLDTATEKVAKEEEKIFKNLSMKSITDKVIAIEI